MTTIDLDTAISLRSTELISHLTQLQLKPSSLLSCFATAREIIGTQLGDIENNTMIVANYLYTATRAGTMSLEEAATYLNNLPHALILKELFDGHISRT